MVDISVQISGILVCMIFLASVIPLVSMRVGKTLSCLAVAVAVTLYFWRLKVPINQDAAEALTWLNLVLLIPLVYFAARYEFNRKWTVPDREPEQD